MAVGLYNRLVALNTRADQAFADIDVQLRQRHDLIPNLVETVKGYATHEKGTLEAVIAARNAATSAGSVADKVQAENALTGALRQMFAVAEAYPELKANTNFLSLQSELSDVENKLTSRTSWPPPAASSTARWPSSTPRGCRSRPSCSRGCSASTPAHCSTWASNGRRWTPRPK